MGKVVTEQLVDDRRDDEYEWWTRRKIDKFQRQDLKECNTDKRQKNHGLVNQ